LLTEQDQKELIEHLISSQTRGDRAQPISKIVPLFRSEDPRLRSRAARLVGRYDSYRIFVDERLRDRDGRVRANVIESLWNTRAAYAVDVFNLAVHDNHPRVRSNAMIGLYHAGDISATQLLIEDSRHDSAPCRASAAWAMGETGDPAFQPILAGMTKDPNLKVRINVARALPKLRAKPENVPGEAAAPEISSEPPPNPPSESQISEIPANEAPATDLQASPAAQ
jgi:HEAT repeat protein